MVSTSQKSADGPSRLFTGHYIENTGNSTLRFIEVFNTNRFEDVSLAQWLALTPSAIVQAHLDLGDNLINHLNKTKQYVVGPAASS